jgi:alpha-L-fucosidase 2
MIRKISRFTILSIVIINTCFGQQPLRLWYDKPAQVWEETLPLGMMPDGGVANENIVLNDITLWSGAPQGANNYNAYKV